MAFKRALARRAGTKIVPDLAESIPKPTNGGKTWTFTLRSGDQVLERPDARRGKDVKATFERLFKIGNSPNAGTWYNVIIRGGDAWRQDAEDLQPLEGIVVNGEHGHLQPDARLTPSSSGKLVGPVRVHPARPRRRTTNVDIPPPGTGPYKWVQYAPNKQIKPRPQPELQGVVEGRAAGRKPRTRSSRSSG